MPETDSLILMGGGGLFLILGTIALMWGRSEEKKYYESTARRRTDLREFLEHNPERPEPGAVKIGGWIAIAIGVVMLAVGGAFRLWG